MPAQAAARCRFCEALKATDAVFIDGDVFDDGAADDVSEWARRGASGGVLHHGTDESAPRTRETLAFFRAERQSNCDPVQREAMRWCFEVAGQPIHGSVL